MPPTDIREENRAQDGENSEPADRLDSVRQNDDSCEKRPERKARVSSDLKNSLGESLFPAGSELRRLRTLRMENGGAATEQRHRAENHPKVGGDRKQRNPGQRKEHPDGKLPGMMVLVRIEADERLDDGRRGLQRKCDKPYLRKGKPEIRLEHRIDGGQHRLDRIVEKVTETDNEKNRKCRLDFFHARKVRKFEVWISEYSIFAVLRKHSALLQKILLPMRACLLVSQGFAC